MNKKRRELLSHNRRIKRKIGSYVLRLEEHKTEAMKILGDAKRLETRIRLLVMKMAMEELRIKEDIDRLIGILNGLYEEEGL